MMIFVIISVYVFYSFLLIVKGLVFNREIKQIESEKK